MIHLPLIPIIFATAFVTVSLGVFGLNWAVKHLPSDSYVVGVVYVLRRALSDQ